MKQLLFLSILFILTANLYSNTNQLIGSPNKMRLTDFQTSGDSLLFVSGYYNVTGCESGIIYSLTNDLTYKFYQFGLADILTVKDEYMLTVGYDIGTDDALGDETIGVQKYTLNGELVSSRFMTYEYVANLVDRYPQYFVALDEIESGKVLLAWNDKLIITDSSFQFAKSIVSPENQSFTGAFFYRDSAIVYATTNSIFLTDTAFSQTIEQAFSSPIVEVAPIGEEIYVLGEHKLSKFDKTLSAEMVLSENESVRFISFASTDEKITVAGLDGDMVYVYDCSEKPAIEVTHFEHIATTAQCKLLGDTLYTIGTTVQDQIFLTNHPIVNPYVYDSSAIAITDAELSNVFYQPSSYSGGISYEGDFKIKVENTGSDTLRSFVVYMEFDGGMNCSKPIYSELFDSLHIAPGDQQWISLEEKVGQWLDSYKTFCIEVYAPNCRLESDLSDNDLCKTFGFVSVTNLENEILLYPNPLKANSSFSVKGNVSRVELYDANGVCIKVFNSGFDQLTLPNLSVGIYSLRVIDETNHAYNQKVVVQ